MVSDSSATSTTRARNTLASSSTWERASWVAATLLMARSRAIAGSWVMFSTSNTFTRLYRLASMRRAWSGFVSTVMVMRETSGFSVRPTVSESMLKARRRNSDATRVNTPGLFSTYTTNVFSIVFSLISYWSLSFVIGGFDQRAGTANHVVQRRARRDHGVDRVFLFHTEVDQHRAIVLTGGANGGHNLRTLAHGHAADSVGLAEFGEVGVEQGRCLVVLLVEEFLPLANHAEISVVDDGDVNFQVLLDDRRQLSHRHLESAVAADYPDLRLGKRDFCANRRRKREAHRAQAPGSDEGARALVFVILRFPHLMLAHVGNHNRVSFAGFVPQIVDDMRRVKMSRVRQVLNIAHCRVAFEAIDVVEPFAAVNGFDLGQQLVQNFPKIADQCDIHFHVLVDFGGIDFNMNLLGVGCVGLEIAGHAIVEAHAEGQQQVGFLNRLIHPSLAVHAHHAEIQRMRRRECAQSEQRERHQNSGAFRKIANLTHSAGNNDAVPGENHRPLGVLDQVQGLLIFLGSGRQVGTVSRQLRFRCFPIELARSLLRIFRDVHQHRPGTSGARHIKGFADGTRDLAGMGHEIVVLGDGKRDAGDVRFLKSVGADQLATDLSRDAHDGRGVEHGRGDARDHVRSARTGGRNRNAYVSADARVAVGHVGCALLVTHQHVMDLAVLQRVVGGKNRAARISEDVLHAFPLETFPDDLCSGFHRQLPIFNYVTPCDLSTPWVSDSQAKMKGPSSAADDGPLPKLVSGYLIRCIQKAQAPGHEWPR